jgi:phosphoenolpyruvate-protein phosphotransferase
MPPELEISTTPIEVLAISPGVAIGPVRLVKATDLKVEETKINPDQVGAEQERLQAALDQAVAELSQLRQQVAQTVGAEEAAIFEAQQLMLQDPDLLAETQNLLVQQHFSAPAALKAASDLQAQQLEALSHKALTARAADLRDAAARAIRLLLNQTGQQEKREFTGPVVLVAYDLTPSDTAQLGTQAVLGICTVVGGPTTHAAILARSLEIPAIAGIDPRLLERLQDNQQIAIDGNQGLLYLQPDEQQQLELTAQMGRQQERLTRRKVEFQQWRTRPGAMEDGYRVQILANVGDLASAKSAAEAGAEGIGLLRTEFLFDARSVFPDEQEQFESYLSLFEGFVKAGPLGQIIVARTLDAGADKPFPALEALIGSQPEANPALGLRGVRIHLLHEELLRQQLRALLRAATASGVELHIMFPMISTLEEIVRLKMIYNQVWQELEEAGTPLPKHTKLGIMVETPAAAVMADVLAREVDFLSIGANDLFQYTMAVDRTNSRVASMFGSLEPAVWRLISQIVQAGARYNKPVAVCGELAADEKIGPVLAGLGIHELSMSPPAIQRVKAALHEHTFEYWQNLAFKLLKAETSSEMQKLMT